MTIMEGGSNASEGEPILCIMIDLAGSEYQS
jgi:hypothetical protein